ncbi:hypothetical protein Tco_0501586, partial [Tanacetum coccineum]
KEFSLSSNCIIKELCSFFYCELLSFLLLKLLSKNSVCLNSSAILFLTSSASHSS